MRVVTFKIDEKLLEKLDTYAIKNGISRSDAIRRAIVKLLNEESPYRQNAFKLKLRRIVVA